MNTDTVDATEPIQKTPMPRRPKKRDKGIRIQRFTDSRNGKKAFRVVGWTTSPTGGRVRVRRNFDTELAAIEYRRDLEARELQAPGLHESLRATVLSGQQLTESESCWTLLRDHGPGSMLRAVQKWLEERQQQQPTGSSVYIGDAVEQFVRWAETTPSLRQRSRDNLRNRVNRLALRMPHVLLADVTPKMVHAWIDGRQTSARNKHGDKLALSRFFSWCAEIERGWIASNPAGPVRFDLPAGGTPSTLTPAQARELLNAAQSYKAGLCVSAIAVALFGGLRTAEIERLQWEQANLADREIRVGAEQSKVGTGRIVEISDTLLAWLRWCDERGLRNFRAPRKDLEAVRLKAGFTSWPQNVLRHTAISVKARLSGSFVDTATWAGNSEPVIRKHYWGRTSSADAQKIMAIRPG